jgi:hypothetical protein
MTVMTKALRTILAALAALTMMATFAQAASANTFFHGTRTHLHFPARAADATVMKNRPITLNGSYTLTGYSRYVGASTFHGPERVVGLHGRYIWVDYLVRAGRGYRHQCYFRNLRTHGITWCYSHVEPGRRRGSGLYDWGSALYNNRSGQTGY